MNGREHTEEEVRVQESNLDYEMREGPRMREDYNEELSGKSAAELEDDIDRIRQDMDSTLTELERKFSPGEILDRTLHYMKGGPGEYVSNLGDQIKTNPLPTTLIGIGLGWLMMGGGQSSHRSSSRSFGDKAGEARERVSEKAGHARGKLSGSASHARERVSETAGKVKGKMEDITHAVGERMHMAGDKMHSMSDRARHARDRMDEARHRSGDAMHQTRSRISDMVHEQPLLLGVMGVAAGALLGAMMPPTRQEDEYFGEVSDRFKEQAVEKGREQMEKAQHVVGAAGETAREEAHRQLH